MCIYCVDALAQAQADAKDATIKLRQDTLGGRHLPVEGPGAGHAAGGGAVAARNTIGSSRGQMAAILLCASLTHHPSFDLHFRGEEIKIYQHKNKYQGWGNQKGMISIIYGSGRAPDDSVSSPP